MKLRYRTCVRHLKWKEVAVKDGSKNFTSAAVYCASHFTLTDYKLSTHRYSVAFKNEKDAMIFTLKWA